MKALKIAGIATAGVLATFVAAVAGIITYVQSADMGPWVVWGAQKAHVPVELAGPVRVRLMAGPEVQLAGLKVGSLQGTGTLATVGRAKVKLAWGGAPFFWKNLQLQEVVAENPTLTLMRDKQGVANWQAPATEAKVEAKETPKADPAEQAEQLNAVLGMLASARMEVTNLNVTLDDAVSGRKIAVRQMNIGAKTEGTKATTTLAGSINAAPVEGKLAVDVADLNAVPLNVDLKAAGLTALLDGKLTAQTHFAGKVDVQTANLKQTLQTLLGAAPAQAPAEELRVVGDIAAGPQDVALKNFTARIGTLLQTNGNVTAKLGATPSAEGVLHAQGANLQQLVELAQGKANPSVPALPFTVDATLSGQNSLTLKDAKITLGSVLNLSANAVVTPGKTPATPTVKATVDANIPNLQALGKAFQPVKPLPAQPLVAHVELNGKDGTYTVPDLTVTVADLVKMNGNVSLNMTDKGPQNVQGKVLVQGANLKAAAGGFGVAAATLPASAFTVGSSFSGQETINLNDLVINLPQLVEATAKLAVTPGKPLNLTGQVNVTRLNATALGYCKVDPAATPAPATVEAAPTTAKAPWTTEPLNLDALRSVAVNLDIAATNIACAKAPVQAVKGKIINTPSQLDVKDLALTFPQNGTANLTLKLEHAGTPKLALQLATSHFPVQEFVPALKAKGVVLPLDTKALLDSNGASTQALAQNLGGTLTVTSDKGQLPYTSLLGNAMALQKMLAGGTALPGNGDGKVDNLKAAYTLKNGVASTDALTVSTGNGAMTLNGSGTVDLAGWVINYKLTPTLHGNNDMAIPVLIKGALTAPAIGADPDFVSKLSGRLAAQGIGKALGMDKGAAKGLGNVVGDVVSGKGLSKEGIGTMLDGFAKKKGSTDASATNPKTDAVKGIINLLGQ